MSRPRRSPFVPAAGFICSLIVAGCFSAGSQAEELTAQPAEPVGVAPLPEPTRPAAAALAAAGDDPLLALVASASTLSVEEADALLHAAYDAYPTPTTRSRAFGAAATAASAAGRHDLAMAWIDWAIEQAGAAPDRDAALAARLAEAIPLALEAGNPVLARDYARRAAGHVPGGVDDPDRRAVGFARLRLVCPDVINLDANLGVYIRVAARAEDFEPGLLATPSAECDYIPIPSATDVSGASQGEGGFRAYAVRSHIEFEERFEEVTAQGLGADEVEARRGVAQRLTGLSTRVEPLFLENVGRGALGYARLSRPGVDDVAAYAYAAAPRSGVFLAVAASNRDWAWPPEALGARAAAGLGGVLAASE